MEKPGRLQSVGSRRVRHDWGTSLSCIGEGNGNPLQRSCLETPRDGGALWAAVYGVAQSRTRLSDFTLTFHFHALEREMATRSSVLAWRIPGTEEPGGLLSMGLHRVGHDWSDLAAAAAAATLENPMDGGAWWATVHGVAKSRTRLSDLTFNFSTLVKINKNWAVFTLSLQEDSSLGGDGGRLLDNFTTPPSTYSKTPSNCVCIFS